jgi:hypothetical protein
MKVSDLIIKRSVALAPGHQGSPARVRGKAAMKDSGLGSGFDVGRPTDTPFGYPAPSASDYPLGRRARRLMRSGD